MRRASGRALVFVLFALLFPAAAAFGANIGTVVPIMGQISDLIHDPQRDLVYLSNFTQNRIEVYSVGSGAMVNQFGVGLQPVSIALSPDGQILWVANAGNSSLTGIDLNSGTSLGDSPLGARPDAIAVGNDGLVLVYGSLSLMRFDPSTHLVTRLTINTPPQVPPGTTAPANSPLPQGFRAALKASPNGNLIIGIGAVASGTNPQMRLFVYEVASGTVLAARQVTGLSSILSVAPDGSRFMAGPFLFDTTSLTILGRTGYIPASNTMLSGGSAFSADGNTIYASFSTQTPINALNPNQPAITTPAGGGAARTLGVLQVLRSSSLAPTLGLRLPENITSKIIVSANGQNLFALCTSGMLAIPIGQLYRYPILDVDATNVVLSVDICNRALTTGTVQVRNAGGGRMTFGAQLGTTNTNAPLVLSLPTGVAPAALRLTFNARNLTPASGLGTGQYAVILSSPEAVNVEPAILVNLNFRDVDQRGTIVPINGLATDMLLDQPRGRLYLTNFMADQIEVYSLAQQRFLQPIRVGSMPVQMAQINASTLAVANSGGEYISIVNLDLQQEVDAINMGPIPINATPQFPRSIAASNNAILFATMQVGQPGTSPGAGSIWQLSLLTHSAFPRQDLGSGIGNVVQGRTQLIAPANGSAIVIADSNGTNTATLRLYDPAADTFPITRSGAVGGFRGSAAASADGSLFVFDNAAFNSVLASRGTLVPTGSTATPLGITTSAVEAVRVQAGDSLSTTPTVLRLQRVDLNTFQATIQFRMPEGIMDINPGATGTTALPRVWPPLQVGQMIGVRGQTNLFRTQVVVDSNSNAYVLTLSGLTVMSLNAAMGGGPNFTSAAVVNAASFKAPVSPGSLISLFGTNLADVSVASSLPLPTVMSGVCVTANEVPIPLLYTSPNQINAQLPTELAAGRITLAVRSMAQGRASSGVSLTLPAASPGVFVLDPLNNRAALVHADDFWSPVTPDNPAKRDETLFLFATGLGATAPLVPSGQGAPLTSLCPVTVTPRVTIGGRDMIVKWAGLEPGYVGLYRIIIYVPGDRTTGDNLQVMVYTGTNASIGPTGAPIAAIR